MKILAIGAHPDDIEIFMYGFLAICRDRGDDIFLAIATDGAAGGVFKGKQLANQRKKEAIKGLQLLGKPFFFEFPDGQLDTIRDAKVKIITFINKIQPDLIITHSHKDYHPDHRALSLLVKSSCSFKYPLIYCETLMGVNFKPDIYFDISKYFKEKKDAILAHKSQSPEKFFKASKLMNRYRSAQCNFPDGFYAECYNIEQVFPFVDIRTKLPIGPAFNPYYSGSRRSFL
jgi:N-acetylglucosamine malate deacetylase 1